MTSILTKNQVKTFGPRPIAGYGNAHRACSLR